MTFANCGAASGFIFAVIGLTAHAAGADYLYASDTANGAIYQIDPNGTVTNLADFPEPRGIGSDGSGNLYVLNTTQAQVVRLGHGQSSVLAQIDPFNALIAADHSDNLYLYNDNNGLISAIASNGMSSPIVGGIAVFGMAPDENGNLFVSGAYGSQVGIFKIPSPGTVNVYSTAVNSPGQLAIDAGGDLFTYNFSGANSAASLVEVTPQGNITTLVANLRHPTGVTVDSAGTVLVTERYQDQSSNWINAVEKVNNGALAPLATFPVPAEFLGIDNLVTSPTAVVVPEPGFAGVLVLAVATLRRRSRQ